MPPRCIILLDDIDCTALNSVSSDAQQLRDEFAASRSSKDNCVVIDDHITENAGVISSEKSFSDITSQPSIPSSRTESSKKQSAQIKKARLTRGGLLNAIDGVSGPTSRILIMTTNFPQQLNPALYRPGRIDFRIEFSFADREQIHEIFMKTMTPFTEEELKAYDEENMKALADIFAKNVPEYKLSPAQIQQYCTEHTDDPVEAANGFSKWLETDKEQAARIANYSEVSKKWTVEHHQYEDDHAHGWGS